MKNGTSKKTGNGLLSASEGSHIQGVHPVLIVTFGSTPAEIHPILQAQLDDAPDLVPWRGVAIDSLPYEDIESRMVQSGWTKSQVAEALPRSHYFHLTSPFSTNFDFEAPLNRSWQDIIFEPALRRIAAKPEAPGCAGTPALGRARVEGNEQDLRDFFESHLQHLTQVRTETLALREGVKVFVITTCRGGTGTGATLHGSAILRSTLTGGEINLHAIMPDVYGGDDRAFANAFAMLRHNQAVHRFDGGVALKSGRVLKAPFESITPIFSSNGSVTLGPVDGMMQEAEILRAYLRAPTQQAIDSRHVDLTDVIPYDLHDMPMHIRVETAVSIRTVLPGTLEYMATEWVRQEIEHTRDRFEEWYQAKTLASEEEAQVDVAAKSAINDLNLHKDPLLARLDSSPTSANALRSFFEQISGMIGGMKAAAIKQDMTGLPNRVRDAFVKFEGTWQDRTLHLATALPREVVEYVMSKMAATPHLALAVLGRIADHLRGLAKEALEEAKRKKKKRDDAGAQLGPMLNSVQEANTLFIWMRDEVTRDAAHAACAVALQAALARVDQQRLEYLGQALEGEISSLDNKGKATLISSVTAHLREIQVEQTAEIRKRQAGQIEELRTQLDDLGKKIEKRSQVFQRSLLYDGLDREKLDLEVAKSRERMPNIPPVVKLLEGKQDLQQTLEDILPLLPSYAESGRSLTEILNSDPSRRNLVVQLLRNRKPFTPTDRVVEDQQGLRNRRDTLVVLEVPGGHDGLLAELMLTENIVANPNQIVDSGTDEIRLYSLRDGLPYAAIRPLQKYQERHNLYMNNSAAITPYITPNAHQYPSIEPSHTNLQFYTTSLLYRAKAVLPHKVAQRPSGEFVLHYEQETGREFSVPKEESFREFSEMVSWLAKRPPVRKALEAELKEYLNNTPNMYITNLRTAWQHASGTERDYLQESLFDLKINPTKNPSIESRGAQDEGFITH
jgi:hypothetical protein